MMKFIKKGKKQSSLRQNKSVRKGGFVRIGTGKSKRNICFKLYSIITGINKVFSGIRHCFKKNVGRIRLFTSDRDWNGIKREAVYYLMNSAIEGFTANFATHYLLGWNFNPLTMLAHGFAIKQSISIYRRLRKDGSNSTVSSKDN